MGGKLSLLKSKRSRSNGSPSNGVGDKGAGNGHVKNNLQSVQDTSSSSGSPKAPRHHPYDEVNEQELIANRKAASNENLSDVTSQNTKQKNAQKSQPDYVNVNLGCAGMVTPSDPPSSNSKVKPGLKLQQPNDSTLNYIEVEVMSSPEVKKPTAHSPCTYSTVLHNDGQIVLAE